MDSLAAKISAEGATEAKAFNEYVEWCDDAAANLHNEIKTGTRKQEELEAAIGKATSGIEACSAKIEELSASISADDNELKEATSVRLKEVSVFEASEKELVDRLRPWIVRLESSRKRCQRIQLLSPRSTPATSTP
jgi:uncharacterized coiled-coil DUF342 family protein